MRVLGTSKSEVRIWSTDRDPDHVRVGGGLRSPIVLVDFIVSVTIQFHRIARALASTQVTFIVAWIGRVVSECPELTSFIN